jgi:glycosyltransferase involved in cell wall biosynthesis
MNNDCYLSVVVCTYNRERFILDALQSLVEQHLHPDNFEIIIVDNNCTDNTRKICEEFISKNRLHSFKYITESNQGLSFARNRGYKEAKGDVVLYLDDDAVAEKNYLQTAKNFLDNNPDVSAIGGKIFPRYVDGEPKWMTKYNGGLVGYIDHGNKQKEYDLDNYPPGSNMIIRKKMLEELGGFNTEIGRIGDKKLGGEERDFFLRLRRTYNKKVIYLPDLIVHHVVEKERLTPAFIKKISHGIGASERIRFKNEKLMLFAKLIEYTAKLFASFVLFFVFLLQLKPAKGWWLIKVRCWVIQGFLFGI